MKFEYFNEIPAAIIYVDINSGDINMNNYAVKLFGKTFYNIEQLEQYLIFGGELGTVPQNDFETKGVYLNSGGENTGLRLKFSAISDSEYFLGINFESIKYDQILNDQLITNFLRDLPIGVIITNISNNLVEWVSPYITRHLGYSKEDVLNLKWRTITYFEDIAKEQEYAQRYGTSIYSLKKRVKSKSGKIVWIEETVQHYFIDNNVIKTQFIIDLSNEMENGTELQRAKSLLEQSQNLNNAFIDNLPHEIRTPLNAIIGFSSLLKDDFLTGEEREEYVRYIQNSGNQILNIINNVLELSAIESNQVRLEFKTCYLNHIFNELSKQYSIDIQNTKKQIELKISKAFDDDFNAILDPQIVTKILNLLVENALKYTEEGEIEIGYQLITDKEIQFYVADTGIGIEQTQLETIFKNFGKSGNVNTDKNRGGGLGLAIVKKLVDLLKGHINVESEIGRGSRFNVILPISKEKAANSITRNTVMDWRTKTLLIAEDTDLNFEYLRELLRKTKINILRAKNGREAIDLFQENKESIDLVLMDILMPEIDGFEATKKILEINPNVPVIAQTALSMQEDKQNCIDAGCSFILVKPIISEALYSAVAKYLS